MRDIFVENFESEPFMTAFKTYFCEISESERNWPMLFRQMNAEKDVTKAIMRFDGNTVVGFIMFCPIRLSCPFFTEEYGFSPINYLISKRLEEAEHLLRTTDFSLSFISNTTGFSSSSYFAQIFRKQKGMSPTQFRKQNRQNTK